VGKVYFAGHPLSIERGRHLTITIHLPAPEDPDAALPARHSVYAGLAEEAVVEVERIARDRSHFTWWGARGRVGSTSASNRPTYRMKSLLSRGLPATTSRRAPPGTSRTQFDGHQLGDDSPASFPQGSTGPAWRM